MVIGAAHAEANAVNPECRFGLGRRAMRQTVVCVSNHFNDVSTSHALYVANRESTSTPTRTTAAAGPPAFISTFVNTGRVDT